MALLRGRLFAGALFAGALFGQLVESVPVPETPPAVSSWGGYAERGKVIQRITLLRARASTHEREHTSAHATMVQTASATARNSCRSTATASILLIASASAKSSEQSSASATAKLDTARLAKQDDELLAILL